MLKDFRGAPTEGKTGKLSAKTKSAIRSKMESFACRVRRQKTQKQKPLKNAKLANVHDMYANDAMLAWSGFDGYKTFVADPAPKLHYPKLTRKFVDWEDLSEELQQSPCKRACRSYLEDDKRRCPF